jgi:thioredoxin-like negative regulator of GroEL
MSEEIMLQAAQAMSTGDFLGAMTVFESLIESEPDNHAGHYGWAEAAFMEHTENTNDEVNPGLIRKRYKDAMKLDPDNLEIVASFASFCLDCNRVPAAVKEYNRLLEMADAQEVDVNDMLYEAARQLVEVVEMQTLGDRSHPMAQKYLKTAVEWAITGLGFVSTGTVIELLTE